MNNFEQLLEQQSRAIPPELQERTEEGLFKTFESLRLAGQLFDVFVPKMVNVLVAASGGRMAEEEPRAGYNPVPPRPPGQKGPSLPEGGADEIR